MASRHSIARLQIHNAVETAFATAEVTPSWLDIKCAGLPTAQLVTAVVDDPTLEQRVVTSFPPILGFKAGSKLTFDVPLQSTQTAAAAAIAAKLAATSPGYPLQQLLSALMGAESGGTGNTASTSSTTSVIKCTSGSGFTPGQAIGLVTSYGFECSPIASKDTNDLTLVRAVASAPAQTDVVYASASYSLAELFGGSLQFRFTGAEGDAWDCYGVLGSMGLKDLGPNQVAKVSFDLHVTSYAQVPSTSLAAATYSPAAAPKLANAASTCYIQTVGTVTRPTPSKLISFALNLGMSVEAIEAAAGGVQGLQGYAKTTCKPTVEFVTDYIAGESGWESILQAKTAKYLHLQLGATAGDTVLIELPRIYLTKVERVNHHDGVYSKITASCVEGPLTGSDLLRSAVKIHLL